MVSLLVEGGGSVCCCVMRREDELERFGDTPIEQVLGDLAILHGCDELAGGVESRCRHLEVRSCGDACNMVVRAAPVGHDSTLVSPLAVEDVLEQVCILVCIDTVDPVVARHDRLGRCLLDHDFEGRKIDLAERPLVEDGVGCLAAGLLAVRSKVLDAGADAFGLDAAHIGGSHLAGKVGVFGVVLEVTAAKRAPLDADARSEKHVHILDGSFLAQSLADLFDKICIPGISERHCCREAGRRKRAADAEMVCAFCLAAEPVRAIGEDKLRHAGMLDLARAEGGGTHEQGALLFERQLLEYCFGIHRTALLPQAGLSGLLLSDSQDSRWRGLEASCGTNGHPCDACCRKGTGSCRRRHRTAEGRMGPKEEGAASAAGSQIAGCIPFSHIRLSRFFRVMHPKGLLLCYS